MAQFKQTRFDLETKGISGKAGEKHSVIVLTAKGKRILVEDAHFHTDSSVFLPRDPGAEGNGIDAPRPFSNDAFWDTVKKNYADYVQSAKEGDFVPPSEENAGGKPGTAESAGGL